MKVVADYGNRLNAMMKWQNNEPINLRENFNALAVFAPNVKTDANGKATVDVKLPDNLTRYRVTAISVDSGKRFGKGESNITARQPLMVRPSAPRFMNFGDKVELPVVVQNQTDKDMTVDVAVRATNAVLTETSGKRVLVKANDRAEVRFPVATEKAGTARFQIAVNSGKFADAAEISLPVWTPATTEAFATYGTTDQNGAIIQPVQTPGDVFPQFGGLEVTTSSTQLQELTDAFIYLYRYKFECSEQVASRMISIAALQDVLKAFKAKEMPTEAELKASFAKDIKILQSRQNENGYFGLWRRDGERYKFPFVTAHVAHALDFVKRQRLSSAGRNAQQGQAVFEKYRIALRIVLSARSALDDLGLRALRPRSDGRQRCGESQEIIGRSERLKKCRLKHWAGFCRFWRMIKTRPSKSKISNAF